MCNDEWERVERYQHKQDLGWKDSPPREWAVFYQHKQMTLDVSRPSERMVRIAFMHITKYTQAIVQTKGYNVNKERTFPQK